MSTCVTARTFPCEKDREREGQTKLRFGVGIGACAFATTQHAVDISATCGGGCRLRLAAGVPALARQGQGKHGLDRQTTTAFSLLLAGEAPGAVGSCSLDPSQHPLHILVAKFRQAIIEQLWAGERKRLIRLL